ncbi:acyl-CoA thioester hydrolase [Streptohalobacillus salinus]|uniref:Acyl-CoA thioester hydrolase n=1 Tax=Streptohalobacillus salinus TaxID=621096 RepID=A0A2V3WCZ0_9BACI|nr:thioesterase family protein [Streptohalobacillus salinus]PXW91862.1 acyl-CoA thioester hydrolase [Streptohalobacillus salinus]
MKKVTKEIEVRYQETDQMGVVYHANYLIWFEIGRTAFIRELGLSYAKMEARQVVSPVTHVEIDFKRPTKYGEPCYVTTWVESYDGLRTRYCYEVTNQAGEICVTGATDHVIVKKDNFRPVSVRRMFPDWHERYLEAMVE